MTKIFNRYDGKYRRQELRNNLTKGEVILWLHISRKQLGGFKFRRQHGIGKFSVDFYCPEIKLAVEVDGITHQFEGVFERDAWRQKLIEHEGIVFKRYTSEDIFNHLGQTLTDLLQTCEVLRERRRRQRPIRLCSEPP